MKALYVFLCLATEHHGQLCRDVPLPYRYASVASCEASAARDEAVWEHKFRPVFGPDYRIVRRYCGALPQIGADSE